MTNDIVNLLFKKHLLIAGKSENERQNLVKNIIINSNYETYIFPTKMKLYNDYIDFIKKEKLFTPWYKAKKYNVNQILDFHRDWIAEKTPLLVFQEFEFIEEKWKIELFRTFLNELENRKSGEKKVKVIFTQATEDGIFEKLSEIIYLNKSENRTKKQIIEQNLELINI